MAFYRFAFHDQGANFAVAALVSEGLQPAVDFAYPYGLLSVLVGQGVFGVFGATPWSFFACILLTGVVMTRALAVCLARLGSTRLQVVLACLILWHGVFPPHYPNFAHMLEAALLLSALAAQTVGRRGMALALVTIAVLAKPALGYFYGALLLVGLGIDARRTGDVRSFARALWPAVVAGVVVGGVLVAQFGPTPFLRTVFPITGLRAYEAKDFGFFGLGRDFWMPPGGTWRYWVGSVAGIWMALSLIIGAVSATTAVAWLRERASGRPGIGREMLWTCTALHVVFVLVLFAGPWSVAYYAYLLILGVCAVPASSARARVAIAVCCLLAVPSQAYWIKLGLRLWGDTRPVAAVGQLWMTDAVRDEVTEAMTLGSECHLTVLAKMSGALPALRPETQQPGHVFLDRSLTLPAELARSVDRARRSECLLVAYDFPVEWDEFDWISSSFEEVARGMWFTLHQNSSLSSSPR